MAFVGIIDVKALFSDLSASVQVRHQLLTNCIRIRNTKNVETVAIIDCKCFGLVGHGPK